MIPHMRDGPSLEDALLSPVSFAMLTGAGLANVSNADVGDKKRINTWFDLPIRENGKVVIDLDTAGDNHDIYVDEKDYPVFGTVLDEAGAPVVYCENTGIAGIEPNCKVYTITKDHALELTFSEASKYVGRTLRVDCYVEKTGGVTHIDIDAENFAGNYYVEAQTFFREESSALDMPVVITLPNVKIQSNFTFNMNNSGDPSTFSFVMDCFPAYTKGNKTKKVFASIDMVADEVLQPAAAGDSEKPCPAPDIAFESVTAGVEGWTKQEFQDDPKKVKFTSLGDNLRATVDRANVDFYGNLKRIDNWTAFSSDPKDLTGYYFPFKLTAENGAKLTMVTPSGKTKTNVFGQTDDGEGTINLVLAVSESAPVASATLESSDGAKKTEYSFDFSQCIFK